MAKYRLELKLKWKSVGMNRWSSYYQDGPSRVLEWDDKYEIIDWMNENIGYLASSGVSTLPIIGRGWRIEEGFGNLFWMDGRGPLVDGETHDREFWSYWVEVDEAHAVQLRILFPEIFNLRCIPAPHAKPVRLN